MTGIPPDDAALVARVRGGDIVAYEALFRAWHARLVTYAASLLSDEAAAEEVVQTVFARVWRNRATWSIETGVRAYLYASVRNGALNRLARRRTERAGQALAAQEATAWLESGRTTPLDALAAAEVAAAVRAALAGIPARRREVLLLRWRHGLSHAEIAAALDISVKAVENHITRGLRSLRERLGGVDPR